MTQHSESCLCRRRFIRLTILGTAAATGAALALGGCASHGVDVLYDDVDIDLSEYPELETEGETSMVSLEELGLPLAITRTGPGEEDFLVTGTECNHQGCGVQRSGDGWKCPCHGAKFDLDGKLRKGPATSGLVRYEFMVIDQIMTVFGKE